MLKLGVEVEVEVRVISFSSCVLRIIGGRGVTGNPPFKSNSKSNSHSFQSITA